MDIEELARTQRNIKSFLGADIGNVVLDSILSSTTKTSIDRFRELTKDLPTCPNIYRTKRSQEFQKALELMASKLGPIKNLNDIVSYAHFDFDAIRMINSEDALNFLKERCAEEAFPDKLIPEIFETLNLPFDKYERDELLIKYFEPLYDKLDRIHESSIEKIESLNYRELYDYIKEINKSGDLKAIVGTSWGLIRSKDLLKNSIARLPIKGSLYPINADSALVETFFYRLVGAYEEIERVEDRSKEFEIHRKNADRNLSKQLEKKKAIEKDYNKEKEKTAELTKKYKELEDRIKELESTSQKTINGDEEELELSTIKENLETWRDLANEYENEVLTEKTKREEAERKLKDIGSLVQDKNREIAKLQKKLSEYDKPISNGTGIEVYATPEFVERYNNDLVNYTDNDLKDSSLSDIIDDMIKHVCIKVNQEGKSIKQDKSFYKVYGLLLYKRNHMPGRFSRLLVKTDYKKKIIVVDVTTKEDHEQNIKKQSGHYHDAVHGEVEYTKDEDKYTKIKSSVKDILSTD